MSYVGSSRVRLQVAGGRFGQSGTASDASGLYVITHGLATVRIASAKLRMSGAVSTAGNTRWCNLRVSGTAVVVRALSRGAALATRTQAGWWLAVG